MPPLAWRKNLSRVSARRLRACAKDDNEHRIENYDGSHVAQDASPYLSQGQEPGCVCSVDREDPPGFLEVKPSLQSLSVAIVVTKQGSKPSFLRNDLLPVRSCCMNFRQELYKFSLGARR